MKNFVPLFLARILVGIPFIVFGAMHILGANDMAFMVPNWLPGGVIWIYLTGLANILVGVAIAANKMMPLAGNLAALLMTLYIIIIHAPGLGDAATQMNAMSGLLKDIGLAGGALLAGHLSGSDKKP